MQLWEIPQANCGLQIISDKRPSFGDHKGNVCSSETATAQAEDSS